MRALYSLIFIGIYVTLLDLICMEGSLRGRAQSSLFVWWAAIASIGLIWMHVWPKWKSERTLVVASFGWLVVALLPFLVWFYL
jgi:hypothetical protein